MTLFVGEAVAIKVDVTNPFTKKAIDPEDCVVTLHFYPPGKNPASVVADRGDFVVGPVIADYDESLKAWFVFQPTAGAPWVAGKWVYQVHLEGPQYDNWEYGSFSLKA